MPPFTIRAAASLALLLAASASPTVAQDRASGATLVVSVPGDVTTPIPTVSDNGTNYEIVNLLYLRLAELGPTLSTVGDEGFRPMLAREWKRRDSVTLAFDLDPRATWHDGRPVTAADVVFSYEWARTTPDHARSLRRISSVTAEGERRVVFRFTHRYAEQLYDATFQLLIVPAHLLAAIPRDSLATSGLARNPVGNGPFRWVRNQPGQLVELAAFEQFFLGPPAVKRLVFRVTPDAEARVSMLLSGEADAVQYLALPAQVRARQHEALAVVPVIGSGVTYALFNQKAYGDRSQPHPILSDVQVRRALVVALDRETMARAVYGGHARVPDGPVPQTFAWVGAPRNRAPDANPARARQLLAAAGWRDSDGDGILDRNGRPLELTVNAPNGTPQRPMLAQQMQARFREIGVKLNVHLLEFGVWLERRNRGEFDLDMSSANLDPTPSGWNWSWSCEGAGLRGRNVGSYCNPRVDSLLARAATAKDPVPVYREILETIRADVPAIFLAAPSAVVAVHKRFDPRPFRAESPWLSLREWKVKPAAPRDRSRGAD